MLRNPLTLWLTTVWLTLLGACTQPNPNFDARIGGGGGDGAAGGRTTDAAEGGAGDTGGSGGDGGSGGNGGSGGSGGDPGDAEQEAAQVDGVDGGAGLETQGEDVAPGDLGPDREPDAPPISDADLTSGLVGSWPMDEGSGTRVADHSGLGNHGALAPASAATTAWKPGRRGTALEIPDVDGTSVTVPSSPSIDSARRALTVAAWVYRAVSTVDDSHVVVASRQYGTASRELYNLALQQNTLVAWLFSEPPAARISVRADRSAPLGTWVHVALTWDGAVARLYQNGTPVGSLPFSSTMPSSPTPLLLGNNANSDGLNQPLVGRMDEVHLYARALSPTDLVALIAATGP